MPELIWKGKYDAHGQIVAPPRVSLPFQTVETVNQSAQERQLALADGVACIALPPTGITLAICHWNR